ncbi:MAG: hypothetical protein EAZ91_13795 [Cytophagales bacterium]|nr:MAG: hypothetical protein EAZ91_13795 [Cytophagales bacterium]
MKTLLYLIFGVLVVSACRFTRPVTGPATPVDEAEYYAPGPTSAEVISSRKLLPDPINGLGKTNDPAIRLTDIRQTPSYTVLYVTFSHGGDPRSSDYSYTSSASEISIKPKSVLVPHDSKDTYKLVKATGIPLSPNSREVRGNERVTFVLYFERLPDSVDQFAMFECKSSWMETCWNITGMRLTSEKKL